MFRTIRKAFRESSLFDPYKKVSAVTEFLWWKLRGSPGPKVPHLVKQWTVRRYAREFNLQTLVETGTNFGQMINVTKGLFRQIYSIELDGWKFERAKKKFAGEPKIRLLHGDSGKALPQLITSITEPCLFWLDGHDGDRSAPVKAELDCIYKHPVSGHVLLLDDARWFDGRTDYPTMEEIREQVAKRYPGRTVEVRDDIIRICRPKMAAGREPGGR